LSILIPSTGTFSATFFSSVKVLAFFAINTEFCEIKTISNTKYRVLLGPFNDIKKLEESFNDIKSLNFENLEILKDV